MLNRHCWILNYLCNYCKSLIALFKMLLFTRHRNYASLFIIKSFSKANLKHFFKEYITKLTWTFLCQNTLAIMLSIPVVLVYPNTHRVWFPPYPKFRKSYFFLELPSIHIHLPNIIQSCFFRNMTIIMFLSPPNHLFILEILNISLPWIWLVAG